MALYAWRTAGILSLSITLATVSQVVAPELHGLGAAGFGVAAAVFLWGMRLEDELVPARQKLPGNGPIPLVGSFAVRAMAALAALVLLGLAYAAFDDNTFTTDGLLFWGLGVLCFILAVWQREIAPEPAASPEEPSRPWLNFGWWEAGVVAVLALAVFFRFYHLGLTPIEMTSDHAEKLVDVHDVLTGQRPIFFPRNTGREAFQFYLTAALIRWTPLGIGHLALKIGTAAFGVVAVWFTILLGRELYNRQVGLLAGALLAMNGWHVAITRIGLRFTFTAAFATPVLLFIFRALRNNRRRDWILAGAFLGIGLHTYIPMRIVPLLLVVLCLVTLVLDRWGRRSGRLTKPVSLERGFWVNAAIGGVTSFVLFLPLLRYMIDEPKMFWMRAASRAGIDGRPLTETLAVLATNLNRAMLMFGFRGDTVMVNTVGSSPVLGWVTGGLFVLGVAYLLWTMARFVDRRGLLLLISLLFLLLPSILSIDFPIENPSVVRTGGAPPVVMIIAALPLYAWAAALTRAGRRFGIIAGRIAGAAGLIAALALCFAYNYDWYFVRYHEQYLRAVTNSRDLAAVVRDFVARGGSMANVYHIPYANWVDTRLIGVHAGDITWDNVLRQPVLGTLPLEPGPRRLFLLHPDDAAALEALEKAYPEGRWRVVLTTTPGDTTGFVVFETPDTDATPTHRRSEQMARE